MNNGILTFEDLKDHIERHDNIFGVLTPDLGNLDLLRTDNLTEIDYQRLSKWMEAR